MTISSPKYILAIGGLDPSGHAGLLADARVFERLKIPYRVAVTAFTVQSKARFFSFESVSPKFLETQLHAAQPGLTAVKLGMLGNAALGKKLLKWLQLHPRLVFLWDPVWKSSTGGLLMRPSAWSRDLKSLAQRADIFTPNIPEAQWILGRAIRNEAEAERAARDLFEMGRRKDRCVVLKGGHLSKGPGKNSAVDWIVAGGKIHRLRARRRAVSRRGTGCAFAAALLAGICRKMSAPRAARFAKAYVLTQLLDTPSL